MRKKTIILLTILFAFALPSCRKTEEKSLLDPEHKTFKVNGISAIDGYEKIANSLKEMGFKMDGEVTELDLTIIGKPFTYYASYTAVGLTEEQASKLTGGLFDNLPSGRPFEAFAKDSCGISLSWYKSGEVCSYTIDLGYDMPGEDYTEVNKRLSTLFPHSKIAQKSTGYKSYYDDNGVEIFVPNSYWININKED